MSADVIENVLRRMIAVDLIAKEEWIVESGRRAVMYASSLKGYPSNRITDR